MANTVNYAWPIVAATDFADTEFTPKVADFQVDVDAAIYALNTGKQDLAARLTAIVATGITLAMFATDIADNDSTMAANSSTRVPTQAAVKAYAQSLFASNDALLYKGAIDASTNPNYPAADAGHMYRISVAGKIGGASGVNVEVGDTITCFVDGTIAGTQAAVGASWNIIQANLDGAVIGPASSVAGRIATFSGTSGKLIQDSGYTLDQSLATTSSPTFAAVTIGGSLAMTRGAAETITGLKTFSGSGQRATFTGAATAATYLDFVNTTGRLIVGIDSSTGGNFFAGSSAYASIISSQANTALILATNSLPRMTISAAGAVTVGGAFVSDSVQVANALGMTFARPTFAQWQFVHGTANTMAGWGVLQATAGLYAMWIASSTQYVGIGTVDPTARLHVVGGILNTGARSFFAAASEPYAVGAKYVSTGGPVYFGASDGTATPNAVISNQAGSAIITALNARTVRLDGYGAGTLVTDSSGNVTTSSDESLKYIVGQFSRGLADLRNMDRPVSYQWQNEQIELAEAADTLNGTRAELVEARSALAQVDRADAEQTKAAQARVMWLEAALERKTHLVGITRQQSTYTGWTAQGARKGIPETVKAGPDGLLNFDERPVLAAHHNAILELAERIEALEKLAA